MDDLLAEFIAEARETLETIAGEIIAWEADPADHARLDAIFRFVHTVKGSCGFLDLQPLLKLSHAAEDALAEVRAGRRQPGPALVSATLAVIDRIGEQVDALERGEEIEEGGDEALIAALAGDDEAAADAAVAHQPAAHRSPARSIRVPVELLDRLMGGVSDLVLARNELSRQLRRQPASHDLDSAFERISSCVAEMRDAITWTRMQRIESLFAALPRLVRSLSAELGKPVSLDIDGADVEMDREMIEMLRDPLTHIVRNAIDHGIETAQARRDAGKSPTGLLQVSARQSGNQIRIAITDDGRGIETGTLIRRALDAGVLAGDEAATVGEREAFDLIFQPGLSTAREVNAVSGRGVGMDVVRANVEHIGGSIEVKSEPGTGTTIELSVPLTLTIIPALVVGVGEELFAIPRSAIDEIISLAKGAGRIETLGGTEILALREARMPLVRLAGLFGRRGDVEGQSIVILRPGRGERFALAVSAVFDHEELVVRPAAPAIMACGLYAGTALPDNGRPLLLLDTAGLAVRAGLRLATANDRDRHSALERPADIGTRALVFTDLDGCKRAIRMGVADRIIEVDAAAVTKSAGAMRLVIGEEIVTVIAAGPLPESGRLRLIRLGDGATQLGYAIGGRADVKEMPAALEPATRSGLIAGVAVVEGEPVELLDAHALFAEYGEAAPKAGERPLCRIDGADRRWTREVLGPLVEAAGYRVIFDEEAGAEQADVVIEADQESADGPQRGDNVVRLSATPDGEGDRVYRYDRTGIYIALRERLEAGGRP